MIGAVYFITVINQTGHVITNNYSIEPKVSLFFPFSQRAITKSTSSVTVKVFE